MHTAQTANYFLELAKCWPWYICRAEKHTALYTRTHMHTPTVFGHPTPPLDTSSHTNCSGLTIHFCRWQSQRGGTPGGVLSYCSQPSAKHTAQSSVNTAAKMGQWCHWEEREKSAESEKQRERARERDFGPSAESNRAPPVLFRQGHSGHVQKLSKLLGHVPILSTLTL